jgi:dynein heavy chain
MHKLLFSYLISVKICLGNKTISAKEWMFFMQGSVGDLREWDDKPDYLEEKTWSRLKNLQGIHYNYDEICEAFVDPAKIPIWKSIMDADDPLTVDLPLQKDFYAFQRLLIYYILCEAKLMPLVK